MHLWQAATHTNIEMRVRGTSGSVTMFNSLINPVHVAGSIQYVCYCGLLQLP